MDGENLTPYPAMLLTTVIDEERLSASMIARVTFDLTDGELTPSPDQPWIVSVEPWESPLGPFDPDQPYRTGGVDLLVRGNACAPGGEPAREVHLSVEVGGFRASAVAIGPRVWRKALSGALVPTDPAPFTALPIGLEASFGGMAEMDGQKAPHPLNPVGKGFYTDEASALHQPLPELEDPAARITTWDDRPEPVGFGLCQYPHPLRLRESMLLDGRPVTEESALRGPGEPRVNIQPSHRMFNRAFPRLIAPSVAAGDLATLTGFSAEGPISFRIPATQLRVRLELGEKIVERTPTIEAVGVDVPARKVFLGYRYPFRYVFVPHQRRVCTLFIVEA
ncbi:DUF2169 family type VI secretion system accessory protein [Chondromyces apiculatus]|uniref:DUF2169 domain-containing protein n=1 Tax=Chondromyces apiculatus DSM 436 TaxID=1192034 RepID=A0A017THG9_9BACT|nr:DUF2169 domain-containing protein [Chondromyces apiculatus]EYF08689.1 Hypothetical protein CAP_2550 [Chondromyces apiculatus DSM 436]